MEDIWERAREWNLNLNKLIINNSNNVMSFGCRGEIDTPYWKQWGKIYRQEQESETWTWIFLEPEYLPQNACIHPLFYDVKERETFRNWVVRAGIYSHPTNCLSWRNTQSPRSKRGGSLKWNSSKLGGFGLGCTCQNTFCLWEPGG